MMKWLSACGVLLVLALFATGLGCSQADSAETPTGDTEKSDTAQAGETEDDSAETDSEGEGGEKAEGDDEDEEEPVPVEVAELQHGSIESVLRFSSNLEAEDEVQVFSQAKRLVRELLVEEGDRVETGEVMLRLQDEEQRSQLAKVQNQLAKTEREYVRQKRLYEQELISQQVYSDASFEYDRLKIEVEDAQRELSYTEVRAPISGTVTNRLVRVGDQVQIGQHLFDIIDFESMVARVFVPEKHLEQLRPGLPARISTAATGDRSYRAKIDRVAPIVDPRSGTVKVTLAVGAQEGLRPGLYVDVDLVTATHSSAVLVPKQAVVYDADQMFVYRLGDERRVERIFIEPQLADKDFVEPREGLSAGDQVVIAGQAGLKDKALVSLPGDEATDETGDEVAMTARRITE